MTTLPLCTKGRFVEIGTRQDIYTNPQHIYTKRLLSAIPKIDVANREAHKKNEEELSKSIGKIIKTIMMKMGGFITYMRLVQPTK